MHKDYFGAIEKVDVIGLIKSLVVPDQVQWEGQECFIRSMTLTEPN